MPEGHLDRSRLHVLKFGCKLLSENATDGSRTSLGSTMRPDLQGRHTATFGDDSADKCAAVFGSGFPSYYRSS